MLYVSYVVTNASWSSAYDIRVFTKDKNMKVHLSLSLSLSHTNTYIHTHTRTLQTHNVHVVTHTLSFHSMSFLQVQYYGLIKQQTGEDWKDTHISLSTAQPSVGGAAPQLSTRLIHFKRPPPRPLMMAGKYYDVNLHA